MAADPIDVVYTWVDDGTSGYLEQLNAHAADPRDADPNRTRDNLEILRYSLRSLEAHFPQVRHVYLFTMRPQVPGWLCLDHPKLRVVHHDAVIDPVHLPTFNSFAIISHLHLLPGLSRRFLYIVDDMLVMRPGLRDALFAADGRPYVHLERHKTVPLDRLDPQRSTPWNLSLANADAALTARFGPRARRHVAHAPQLIDREVMAAMVEDFAPRIAATRAARFRAGDNVPPEYLYAHYALETGAGVRAPKPLERQMRGYAALENFRPWTLAQLAWLQARRPLSITLNDNFHDRPNPAVEALVRRRMQAWFPAPCGFESRPD